MKLLPHPSLAYCRITHFLLVVALAMLGLLLFTGCSTPPIAKVNPNGEIILVGSGSFMEDTDYEEQEPIAIVHNGGKIELRLRVKKHGKRQTTVPNNAIAGMNIANGFKAQSEMRASDNALKAAQAKEVTKQTEIITAPTKYLPAEGEAISRASDAGITPVIP